MKSLAMPTITNSRISWSDTTRWIQFWRLVSVEAIISLFRNPIRSQCRVSFQIPRLIDRKERLSHLDEMSEISASILLESCNIWVDREIQMLYCDLMGNCASLDYQDSAPKSLLSGFCSEYNQYRKIIQISFVCGSCVSHNHYDVDINHNFYIIKWYFLLEQ